MVAIALVALALAAPAPKVTLDGVGGVRPGATAAAVSKAWNQPVVLGGGAGLDCSTAAVRIGPMIGYAIFVRGRFAAVFFDHGAVTDTRIRIGSPVAALRRAYGAKLTSRPDKYVSGARNYFVKKRWQLRFDVSPGGRVTRIGFGNAAVRLVEGCA